MLCEIRSRGSTVHGIISRLSVDGKRVQEVTYSGSLLLLASFVPVGVTLLQLLLPYSRRCQHFRFNVSGNAHAQAGKLTWPGAHLRFKCRRASPVHEISACMSPILLIVKYSATTERRPGGWHFSRYGPLFQFYLPCECSSAYLSLWVKTNTWVFLYR